MNGLITGSARDAEGFYTSLDGIEHFTWCFLQLLIWSLTVNGIDHYFLWLYVFYCFEPRTYIFLGSIVHIISTKKHRLNDDMTFEHLEILDDFLYIIVRLLWTVQLLDVIHIDRVELQNIVIDKHEGLPHFLLIYIGGIAENREFCLWKILVAYSHCVLYDSLEVGMSCRLTITCESYVVERLVILVSIL